MKSKTAMPAIAQWSPFQEIEDTPNGLAALCSRPPARSGCGDDESLVVVECVPLAKLPVKGKEYLIKAELPGVKKEEVGVSLDGSHLQITARRKFEQRAKGRKFHRVVRAYGSFSLPGNADGNKVTAEFKDGTLLVHLLKNVKASPKHIAIKVV